MNEVWSNMHPLENTNSRYYFNPYTLKLEPITTDQGHWTPIQEAIPDGQYKNILSNQSYLKNLSSNLKKVESTVSGIEEFLSYPQSMFPVDHKKNTKIIKDNMKKILNNKEKYIISPIMTHSVENIYLTRMWLLNHRHCPLNSKPLNLKNIYIQDTIQMALWNCTIFFQIMSL